MFKLEANLSHLNYFRGQIKQIQQNLIKTGAGSSVHNKRDNLVWKDVYSVFNGRIKTGILVKSTYIDPKECLNKIKDIFENKIAEELKRSLLKVHVILSGEFIWPSKRTIEIKFFNTSNSVITNTTNLTDWYTENLYGKILTQLSEFQEKESGWALHKIMYLRININNYLPISGGCYVDLPKDIKAKNAAVNVKSSNHIVFCGLLSPLFTLRIIMYIESAPIHIMIMF